MVRPTTKVYSRTMSDLLAVYDDQLRTDAETSSADTVTRMGPLWLATFGGGRGFVTVGDRARQDSDPQRPHRALPPYLGAVRFDSVFDHHPVHVATVNRSRRGNI